MLGTMSLRLAIVLGVLAVAGVSGVAAAAPSDGTGGLTIPIAVALGTLQGATEFLPVSSSGHLALSQAFFGIDPELGGHRFSILAHLGTLMAVLWMYRRDVLELAGVLLHPLTPSPARTTLLMMVVATLPLGLVLVPGVENAILAVESSPRLVGGCLLATAVVLFVAFRRPSEAGDDSLEPPRLGQAILVGLAQMVAVLPGISRSGSTIAMGLGLGMDRTAAARFSFLISIPAILGATVLEVRKLMHQDTSVIDPWPYVVGCVVSFVVGLACLRLLLVLVRSGRIMGFVVYLAAVGTAAVIWGG